MSPTSSFLSGVNCPLDLTTRKGPRKVYRNFTEIYERIDNTYAAYEGNQYTRGGTVAVYVKMCAHSILRNMLFRQGETAFSMSE